MTFDYPAAIKKVTDELSTDAAKEFETFWADMMAQPDGRIVAPMKSTLESIYMSGYVRGAKRGLELLFVEIRKQMTASASGGQ